ncbi:hypothetical protein C7H85_16350 [Zobellella endophytica]|uniref:HTH tetR-type domain-containing protein n=2 Tax=Zobellella endophytica TaxID=2116700 RepID=A0A2P7R0V8_9GAMM|nr:hypothetical protein C7H85_16350 [Zobellella endophytica]
MQHHAAERDAILDAALHLALHSSWASFSLLQLAESRELTLAELGRHFRSRDDLAEALFDRADAAMLALPPDDDEPADERLFIRIMAWLDYLAPYRRLVRDMLAYKLEPGHLHLQAHGITRISRTVQWFMEAARWQASGAGRIGGEILLTGIYLTTFAAFLADDSEQHQATRALLSKLLHATFGQAGH